MWSYRLGRLRRDAQLEEIIERDCDGRSDDLAHSIDVPGGKVHIHRSSDDVSEAIRKRQAALEKEAIGINTNDSCDDAIECDVPAPSERSGVLVLHAVLARRAYFLSPLSIGHHARSASSRRARSSSG